MNNKRSIQFGSTLLMALFLTACGSSGSSSPGNGDAIKLGATALKTKTVVAAAPKSKLDTMLAFFGGKEAVAAIAPDVCGPGNDGRGFDLKVVNPTDPAAFVCLTEALLVYEEVELENEGGAVKDEVEAGPFLIDLIGNPDDGIAGTFSLTVPNGRFNKLELEVGDLDEDKNDNDDSLDDSPGSNDDFPTNVSLDAANAVAMAGKSLKITGIADDGAGNTQAFVFFSNIEGKLEMPIDLVEGEQLVVDGSTLITFIDPSIGFSKLAFADFPTVGDMNGSFTGDAERCGATPTKFQRLACDIVQNVELYHDDDNDNSFDDSERRGDNRGANGFDDNPGARD